jgi:hypothetical protein
MKRWILGAVAVCTLGVSLTTWHFVNSASPVCPRFSWAPGRKYVYAVTYKSEGETTAIALGQGQLGSPEPQTINTAYAGTLEEYLVQARAPHEFDVWVRLTPTGPGPAVGCLASVTDDGKIRRLTFAPSTTQEARQTARVILGLAQVQWPDIPGQRSWDARETDLTGTWPVAYRLTDASAREVSFIKEPRGGVAPTGMEVRRTGALHGTFSVTGNHLTRLSGKTATEFWTGKRRLGMDKVAVDLALTSVEDLGTMDLDEARALFALPSREAVVSGLDGQDEFERLRLATLRQRIEGVSLHGLMGEFQAQINGSNKAMLAISQKLEAFLELDPEAAARACYEALTHMDPKSAAFSSIAANLTAVGNDAAQEALRDAMDALRTNEPAVKQLIPHLAMVKHPSQASEDALRGIVQRTKDRNVAASAKLGLGAMGRSVLRDQPERAVQIFAEAREALAQGDDKELQLHVLGNMGHPEQVKVAQEVMRSESGPLRGQALYSLRFVQTAESQQVLTDAAQHDADTGARTQALEALGFQAPDPHLVSVYIAQLHTEKSVPVLREVLRNLARTLRTSAEAREAFEAFLQHCGHPDLCPFAEGLWGIAS